MTLFVSDVHFLLDEWAPFSLACEWDNSGLQTGSWDEEVNAILVSLDVTSDTIKEAQKKKANLIVSHHPLIFKPSGYVLFGSVLAAAIRENINVISAHTNLDKASGGVSDILAEKIGLEIREPLVPEPVGGKLKLVTFVPAEKVGEVMSALFEAGAGFQGEYSACSFGAEGIGTFFADEESEPVVGKAGEFNQVEEIRLETVIRAADKDDVIKTLKEIHPYEEPVIDVYRLEDVAAETGLGRIGELDRRMRIGEFIKQIDKTLSEPFVFYGEKERMIERVAVCAGRGDDLLDLAISRGADLFLSGEIGYHSVLKAKEAGIALVDAGHRGTEIFIVSRVQQYLSAMLDLAEKPVKVFASAT